MECFFRTIVAFQYSSTASTNIESTWKQNEKVHVIRIVLVGLIVLLQIIEKYITSSTQCFNLLEATRGPLMLSSGAAHVHRICSGGESGQTSFRAKSVPRPRVWVWMLISERRWPERHVSFFVPSCSSWRLLNVSLFRRGWQRAVETQKWNENDDQEEKLTLLTPAGRRYRNRSIVMESVMKWFFFVNEERFLLFEHPQETGTFWRLLSLLM